jgi:SAM-dependent methyltransferase
MELVWGAEPNRFVVTELEGRSPPGSALDLACGEGRNAIWLAERGWNVTGVDFSDVAVERARQLAARRGLQAEWLTADLATYQPKDEAYDLVLIAYLQLGAEELRAVLTRAVAALAPRGEMLLIGHARSNLSGGFGGPRDPAVLWVPEQIECMLEALGLDVERCAHVLRPVDTPEGPREAIDVLARAHRPASA